MSSPAQFSRKVCFGEFELNLDTAELQRNGNKAILPGQPFQVLVTLLDRPGQLVAREELKKQLWSSDTYVDFDQSLNKAVNRLREALDDSAEHPVFIETLPRRGYRFIGTVRTEPLDTCTVNRADQAAPSGIVLPFESAIAHVADQELTSDRAHFPVARPEVRKYLTVALITLVMAAVLVFAVFKWPWRSRYLDVTTVEMTKLTDSGTAVDVAISPDGRYVAYASRDGEKESLWLRQVATKSAVQVVPADIAGFHGLTFSPDGNYIFFVRSDKSNPFFKYLYSIPSLGGVALKLATDVDSPVSFSPDGRQFVYERCIPSRLELELEVVNVGATSERTIARIHNATCSLFQPGLNWSPDGRSIAVSAWIMSKPERWVLDIVSAEDGSVRELFSSPDNLGRPVWLHHGDTLLMSRYNPRYHRSQLWAVSFPAGQTHLLTNDLSQYGVSLDTTHDQRTLATIVSASVSNVWVAPAAAPSKGRQITAGSSSMSEVVQNANGKLLITSADGELWTTNIDGGERASFGNLHDAGWVTPCGRSVVFLSYERGLSVLTRVDLDGSHAVHLVEGHLWSTACSTDGRFVFYANFDHPQKAWRVFLEGGAPQEITNNLRGICGRLSVSPDGKFLAYPYSEYLGEGSGWHLAVIASSGGPPIKTFDVPGGIGGVSWSNDGKTLQYLLTREGTTNIWEQPLVGGTAKQLTKFTSGRIFDFNWSSDHQQLLLTRGVVTSDVVLLSNFR